MNMGIAVHHRSITRPICATGNQCSAVISGRLEVAPSVGAAEEWFSAAIRLTICERVFVSSAPGRYVPALLERGTIELQVFGCMGAPVAAIVRAGPAAERD